MHGYSSSLKPPHPGDPMETETWVRPARRVDRVVSKVPPQPTEEAAPRQPLAPPSTPKAVAPSLTVSKVPCSEEDAYLHSIAETTVKAAIERAHAMPQDDPCSEFWTKSLY